MKKLNIFAVILTFALILMPAASRAETLPFDALRMQLASLVVQLQQLQIQLSGTSNASSTQDRFCPAWGCTPPKPINPPPPVSITPSLSRISPASGPVGTVATIFGIGFGSANTVTMNGKVAALGVKPQDDGTLLFTITSSSVGSPGKYKVAVFSGGLKSNELSFVLMPQPLITSISPVKGRVSTTVTIYGKGFGLTPNWGNCAGTSASAPCTYVKFGDDVVPDTVSSNRTSITFVVPAINRHCSIFGYCPCPPNQCDAVTPGDYQVTVIGINGEMYARSESNAVTFTVLPNSKLVTSTLRNN